MEKIKLGISTCLVGENVRYDGSHKLDRFLTETLGQFVGMFPCVLRWSVDFPFQGNRCISRETLILPGWLPHGQSKT